MSLYDDADVGDTRETPVVLSNDEDRGNNVIRRNNSDDNNHVFTGKPRLGGERRPEGILSRCASARLEHYYRPDPGTKAVCSVLCVLYSAEESEKSVSKSYFESISLLL